MRHSWSKALRPAAIGAAALGLTVGVLGAGAGVAGAANAGHHGHHGHHGNHGHHGHHKNNLKSLQSVYKYPNYVGGHGKAKKNKSPVYIGIVNQQTSTNAVAPVWTTGAKVAVQYINDHTHGVDGHPLKAVYCAIPTTVGAAAKCGEKFANDHKIPVVVAGAIDVGNTALESALTPSKKPTVFGVSISTVDEHDKHGFILYNTGTQVEAPMASVAKKQLHAKSVSLVYPSNIPGNVYQAGVVYKALKYEGIKNVYKVGFTAGSSSFTGPFEAAHVGKTTLFILVNSGGPACSNAYHTMKSMNVLTTTKVLVNVPCDTPTIAKADGGQLPHGWYYLTANPLPGSKTKAVTAAEKVFSEYTKGPIAFNAWAADAFGQVLTVAKLETNLMQHHKKVTPHSVTKSLKKFRGPVVQGAPNIHCHSFKGTPATCNDLDRFFQNTKPTVMTAVGGWIGPPKGFHAPVT